MRYWQVAAVAISVCMRLFIGLGAIALSGALGAQAPGHWPPDSLSNTRVIPHATPVIQVVGIMRSSWRVR